MYRWYSRSITKTTSSSRSSSSSSSSSSLYAFIIFCCFCATDIIVGFTTTTTTTTTCCSTIGISSSSSSSSKNIRNSIIRNGNRVGRSTTPITTTSRSRSCCCWKNLSCSPRNNNRIFVLSMSDAAAAAAGVDDDDDEVVEKEKEKEAIWTNLVPDDDTAPVRLKRIVTKKVSSSSTSALSSSSASTKKDDDSTEPTALLKPGSTVRIEYVGRLVMDNDNDDNIDIDNMGGISSWTTQDVLQCWLKEQQGLYELLANSFIEHNINGSILLNENIFTEQYVSDTLDSGNNKLLSKIQCKKTIMAVKRLRNTMNEFEHGYIFDSSNTNPNLQPNQYYEFVLGHPKKKPIKAISLLLESLTTNDIGNGTGTNDDNDNDNNDNDTIFIIKCRSDYGYGSDGYRTNKGIIVVPPFATLQFDIKILSSSAVITDSTVL